MRILPAVFLTLAALPAWAQDPRFSPAPTMDCLALNEGTPEARSCIGLSAGDCMETTPLGSTTVGMGFCLDAELSLWDARLNAVYKDLMAADRARDADMKQYGSNAPSMADALRAMQRAWIAYRDTRCDYERSQWGGGTGGGPATYSCLMHLTGEQALYLESTLMFAGQ